MTLASQPLYGLGIAFFGNSQISEKTDDKFLTDADFNPATAAWHDKEPCNRARPDSTFRCDAGEFRAEG